MRLKTRLKKLEASKAKVTCIVFRKVMYENRDGSSDLNNMWANLIGVNLTVFLEPGETEEAFRARVKETAAGFG